MNAELILESLNALIGIAGFAITLFALNRFRSRKIRFFVFLLSIAMLFIGLKELVGVYGIFSGESDFLYTSIETISLIVLSSALFYAYSNLKLLEL